MVKVVPALLALATLLWPNVAAAVELRELAVTFHKFPGKTYFSELPDETIREKLTVGFDAQLVGCLYWWNEVGGMSTDAQFRWLYWNHRLSCRLRSVELGYEHLSQHSLDRVQPSGNHFPVRDSLFVRWTIYRKD